MITFVLSCLFGYIGYKAAEDKYPLWVNLSIGIIWALAIYGLMFWVSMVYNKLFGPQITLLKVLSNL